MKPETLSKSRLRTDSQSGGAQSNVPCELNAPISKEQAAKNVLKLAVTGFVSEQAGSVASANALLLRELLLVGHEIHFFSKASFVDPRPAVGNLPGFRFYNVSNTGPDQLRRRTQNVPIAGFLAGCLDAFTYNKLLFRVVSRVNAIEKYDLCFCMGDYDEAARPAFQRYLSSRERLAQMLAHSSGRVLK